MDKIKILSSQVSNTNYEEILEQIKSLIAGSNLSYIVTPNPEIVLYAQKHPDYQQIINSADIAIPDGFGLLLAARLRGQKFQQRITGTNLAQKLLGQNNSSFKIFLLGGQPGAGEKIKEKFSQANIVGFDDGGIINKLGQGEKDQQVTDKIKQEYWLARNKDQLTTVKLAICVGGAFDYLSGTIKRAPKWLRQIGLEWLYRLFRQPKRFVRIFRATIVFTWKILF